jgi:predicted short-subunit dehydrogenase-like oxidoreductase (DUF2520 family)
MSVALTSLGLVGAGAVARALACGLARPGFTVRAWARDPRRARAGGDAVFAATAQRVECVDRPELAREALVVLCVSDRALGRVAEELAAELAAPAPGAVCLHTSGALDEAPLAPLAAAGWTTGTLHPLTSLPPGVAAAAGALRGRPFLVSGAPAARARAIEVVRALDGRVLRLAGAPGARVRYHAAAALLAGGTVALFDAAERLLSGDLPAGDARAGLADLLASVVPQLAAAGPRVALSGPAARGDAEVVAAHLGALDADTARLYRTLVRRMARLAHERGTLDDAGHAALEALLADAP